MYEDDADAASNGWKFPKRTRDVRDWVEDADLRYAFKNALKG